MTLKELRRNAHSKLQAQPRISSPELDADLIIMYVLDLTKEEKQCQNAQNSRCLSILISQMKSESRCFNSTKTLSMPEKPMKVLLRIAMTSIS